MTAEITDHRVVGYHYPTTYDSIEFIKDDVSGEIVLEDGHPLSRNILERASKLTYDVLYTVSIDGKLFPDLKESEAVKLVGKKRWRHILREYRQLVKANTPSAEEQ